ncbi:LysR family transcriptional regulator [Aliikangiella marina]|uniref:LysR family transcriptional regulator n=1 Tax=Aliikangiella marina TaxID=1712262 RepID=A0A545TJB8_9GAMM|nr:LysR family transcriptional regulator [Aliikangiella marina]TQV77266.1 LysR family transcriptional regulator [Aliikangiella marina]
MRRLASIRGLRTFCIAAKCLSFKQAAEELYITPSAVSHQVKQLEEHLSLTLFERQTRALALTKVGIQFYKAIQPIMHELDSTISEFTSTQENTVITISMPEFFASELFIPRLSEWTNLHKDFDLQVVTLKPSQTSSKTSDLSIVLSNSLPSAGLIDELFSLSYVPACNQTIYDEYADQGYAGLNQLPLIVHRARPWAWHQWADRAMIDDFNPKQIIELDSMFAIARAAQQGMGLALIPMPIGASWFKEKLLFNIYKDALVTNDRYFLVQHEGSKNVYAMRTISEWIKATYQNIG